MSCGPHETAVRRPTRGARSSNRGRDGAQFYNFMLLFYTHGLGGSPRAQPEIDDVFAPLGYTITRVTVPHHGSVPVRAGVASTSTMTAGAVSII
jgi:hypothetical protein